MLQKVLQHDNEIINELGKRVSSFIGCNKINKVSEMPRTRSIKRYTYRAIIRFFVKS